MSRVEHKTHIAREDLGWDGVSETFERITSTGATITVHHFGNEVDVLTKYGDNVNYTGDAISAADIAITAAGKNFWLGLAPGTWIISDDLTVTQGLRVPYGTILSIASGKTLTINGPFDAGLYQVFSGAGSVSFGRRYVKEVYTEWWGAIPDGSTDSIDAINSAIATQIPVKLNVGVYKITSGISITNDLTQISGMGNHSIIFNASTDVAITIDNASGVKLSDFTVWGNGTPSDDGGGIKLDRGHYAELRNIYIISKAIGLHVYETCSAYFDNIMVSVNLNDDIVALYPSLYDFAGLTAATVGIKLEGTATYGSNGNAFTSLKAQGCSSHGLEVTGHDVQGNLFTLVVSEGNGGWGIYVNRGPTGSIGCLTIETATGELNTSGMLYVSAAFDSKFSSIGAAEDWDINGCRFCTFQNSHASSINIDNNSSQNTFENIDYNYLNDSSTFVDNSESRNFHRNVVNKGTWKVLYEKSGAWVTFETDHSDKYTSGTGEDDLQSEPIAAGTMGTKGGIKLTAVGWNQNANGNKTIKLHFGASSWTVHPAANNVFDWELEAMIFNTATNAQRIKWRFVQSDSADPANTLVLNGYETAAIDTTANVTLKLTGECAHADDKIWQHMWLVERM